MRFRSFIFIPHTKNRDCDVCGWTFKETELKKRYDGAMVCEKDYDPPPPEWNRKRRRWVK